MAKVKKTETLTKIDELDNLRIVNKDGLKLCFKTAKDVVLTKDEVTQLVVYLDAWLEHGEFEPSVPEPPA